LVKVKTQGKHNIGNRRINESRKNLKKTRHAAFAPDTKVNSVKNTDIMNVKIRTMRAGQIAFIIPDIDVFQQH
jgi:hypothetical protein